jgi:hypothetical protein
MPAQRHTEQEMREWLALWAEHGYNAGRLEKATGVPRRTWSSRLSRARSDLPDSGVVVTDVPEGMRFNKTTVQYDGKGNVLNEWRRLSKTPQDLEAFCESLAKTVKPITALPKPKKAAPDKRTMVFPIYDPHFGKYAWAAETGDDYDVEIARRILVRTAQIAARDAGRVGEVVVVCGGDWYHADNRTPQTERSGHVLDVDSRVERVRDITINALKQAVETFAAIADRVHIVCIPGNHDHESMHWTARILEAYYRECDNITVDRSPRSRRYLERGKLLLGIDHGMKKMQEYLTLMPAEAPEAWARTTERLWLLGHIHTKDVLQKHGVTVEHLESISATDAWHAEEGYIGNPRRTTTLMVHHDHGVIARRQISVKEAMSHE